MSSGLLSSLSKVSCSKLSRELKQLQTWRLCNLPQKPLPVVSHSNGKKLFPDVQTGHPVFQLVPNVSYLVTVIMK